MPNSNCVSLAIVKLLAFNAQKIGVTWPVAYLEIWKGRGPKCEGVPQRGPGAEPRWGLGAKPPEAKKHDINFVLRITLIGAYIPFLFRTYHYTLTDYIFTK